MMKNQAAVELGKLGGAVKSTRKAITSAENGRKAAIGQKFTIRSNLHKASINVVAEPGTPLSDSQVKRINRALCGMPDCRCGGINWATVDGNYELVKDHEMRGCYHTDIYIIYGRQYNFLSIYAIIKLFRLVDVSI